MRLKAQKSSIRLNYLAPENVIIIPHYETIRFSKRLNALRIELIKAYKQCSLEKFVTARSGTPQTVNTTEADRSE